METLFDRATLAHCRHGEWQTRSNMREVQPACAVLARQLGTGRRIVPDRLKGW